MSFNFFPEDLDNIYNRALSLFKRHGYFENSLVDKNTLTGLLDSIARKKIDSGFPRGILEDLWGHAETISKGETTFNTMAKILSEAHKILEERIKLIQSPNGLVSKLVQLDQLKVELKQRDAQAALGFDSNQAETNSIRQEIGNLEVKIKSIEDDLTHFKQQRLVIQACLSHEQMEQTLLVSRPQPKQSQKHLSKDLLWIFHFTNLSLLLELVALSHRLSLLTLLVYTQIYLLLFIGYYSQSYVKYILLQLLISILMDFIQFGFLIFSNYFVAPHRLGNNEDLFFVCCWVFVGVEVGLRVALGVWLWSFREITQTQWYFRVMETDLMLSRRMN